MNYRLIPPALPNLHLRCLCLMMLCLCALLPSSAQNGLFKLLIKGPQADSFRIVSGLPATFLSAQEGIEAIHSARQELMKQGYLACSIDSTSQSESALSIWPYLGQKFSWAILRNGNIPAHLLNQYRFDPKKYFGKPLSVQVLYPFFDKIIRYYEDNGYPFCRLYLDSIQSDYAQVSGALTLDQGPLTRLDTVILNEDVNINRHYVFRFLGLKQKMLYNESKIGALSTRLREIPFLAESYPWRLDFTIAKTTLNLYLKNKSANRADVLIGLLPNNEELGGKFLLTGDVKLAFANALGQGEQIQLNWQNLQYRSPRYNIQFSLPFLLRSPIGITGRFDFYKKDTTFKTTNGELGLIYQFNAFDQVKVYYELAGNRLGSVNVNNLISTRSLPANGDATYRTVGMEISTGKVDYRLNPRKGYRLMLNAGVSFRNLIRNTTIENTFDPIAGKPFSYLYDSLDLRSYKYNVRAQFSHYTPLGKRISLAKMYSGGLTYSTNPLFRNELFQIGGYRLLRGFDEGSFFVNQYHVITMEPRYLLSLNSYFFLFGDLAYVQSKYLNTFLTDIPYSLGAGMTFETRAGLFNISYAVGGRTNIPLQFRGSKVHFGYINYF